MDLVKLYGIDGKRNISLLFFALTTLFSVLDLPKKEQEMHPTKLKTIRPLSHLHFQNICHI